MKKNIKQNNLTLKSLQAELEALKAAKDQATNTNKVVEGLKEQPNKVSYVNRIYMKSSMFTLWLITTILSYAHKLPIVRKLINVLSIWYGRTRWWEILVIIRKILVVFNAIIGVYVVFKGIGFSIENTYNSRRYKKNR